MTRKLMAIIAAVVLSAAGIGYGVGYRVAYTKYEKRLVDEDVAFKEAIGTWKESSVTEPKKISIKPMDE